MAGKKYYIQNKEAGYLGNAIMFWKKGNNGYTADLDNSQQFTEEDAKHICLNNPEKNKAWEVNYIDKNKGIQRIVDSQYLESSNIVNFNLDNK